MFSRLHLCATPTRTRLKIPHRAELPFRSSPLSHSADYSTRSLSPLLPHRSQTEMVEVAGGGSTTHRGVSRIEDRSDSLPPCLLPRLARASLTGAARKLRASPCARMSSSFHHPTFGKRLSLSLPLVQTLLFLFYSPYLELHIPVFDHALSYHATPCHATLHRTKLCLHRCLVCPDHEVQRATTSAYFHTFSFRRIFSFFSTYFF